MPGGPAARLGLDASAGLSISTLRGGFVDSRDWPEDPSRSDRPCVRGAGRSPRGSDSARPGARSGSVDPWRPVDASGLVASETGKVRYSPRLDDGPGHAHDPAQTPHRHPDLPQDSRGGVLLRRQDRLHPPAARRRARTTSSRVRAASARACFSTPARSCSRATRHCSVGFPSTSTGTGRYAIRWCA